MALIFGPAYYAGYGKLPKGIVLAAIGFIPLTAVGANLYAAIKANAELPVGDAPFNWGSALIAVAIQIVITSTSFALING